MTEDEHERDVIRPEILDYTVDGVRLHREQIDPSMEFVLGVGTVSEQSLQWPNGWSTSQQNEPMLAKWWNQTDDQLRRLRTHFAEPGRGRSQNICLVDGIWLVWCYASTDIKNLYAIVGELQDQIADLQAQLGGLRQELRHLRQGTQP